MTSNGFGSVADIAASLIGANDPASMEALNLLEEIARYEVSSSGPGGGPGGAGGGMHIGQLVPYLKVYKFSRQNPVIALAAAGAVVLGIGALGYMLGRGGKSA